MSTDDTETEFEPREVLRLADLLKRRGLVGTGGEAKIRIQSGEITLNGIVETRRRKQLSIGDRVQLGDIVAEVTQADFESDEPT
jgi:ribosome-associated protein